MELVADSLVTFESRKVFDARSALSAAAVELRTFMMHRTWTWQLISSRAELLARLACRYFPHFLEALQDGVRIALRPARVLRGLPLGELLFYGCLSRRSGNALDPHSIVHALHAHAREALSDVAAVHQLREIPFTQDRPLEVQVCEEAFWGWPTAPGNLAFLFPDRVPLTERIAAHPRRAKESRQQDRAWGSLADQVENLAASAGIACVARWGWQGQAIGSRVTEALARPDLIIVGHRSSPPPPPNGDLDEYRLHLPSGTQFDSATSMAEIVSVLHSGRARQMDLRVCHARAVCEALPPPHRAIGACGFVGLAGAYSSIVELLRKRLLYSLACQTYNPCWTFETTRHINNLCVHVDRLLVAAGAAEEGGYG